MIKKIMAFLILRQMVSPDDFKNATHKAKYAAQAVGAMFFELKQPSMEKESQSLKEKPPLHIVLDESQKTYLGRFHIGFRSSVQLMVTGYHEGLTLEIQLPGVSDWLDCTAPYAPADNTKGALVGRIQTHESGAAIINVTFGVKSTFDSHGCVDVRVASVESEVANTDATSK